MFNTYVGPEWSLCQLAVPGHRSPWQSKKSFIPLDLNMSSVCANIISVKTFKKIISKKTESLHFHISEKKSCLENQFDWEQG